MGSPDKTDRQRIAAHTTASGAPATVELAASGLVLAREPLAANDPPVSLWQPGGLGRTAASAPLVAKSRARRAPRTRSVSAYVKPVHRRWPPTG